MKVALSTILTTGSTLANILSLLPFQDQLNELETLPESIGKLKQLKSLILCCRQLIILPLPESIDKFVRIYLRD